MGRRRRPCLEALELSRTLDDSLGEGRALLWLGRSAYRRHDLELARRYTEEGVQVLAVPGGEYWRLRGLSNIAIVLSALGEHSKALAIGREVVAEARRDSSDFALAMLLNHLGELERVAGDTAESRRLLEESVQLLRGSRKAQFLGGTLHSLGCALRASAPTDALAAFSEALGLARDLDTPDLAAACFEGAASMFAAGRDPEHAASLLGAAATIRRRVRADPHEQADADAAEARCREALTAEAFISAWEQGAALEPDAAAEWALAVWRTWRE